MKKIVLVSSIFIFSFFLVFSCAPSDGVYTPAGRFDTTGSVQFVQDGMSVSSVSAMATGLSIALGLTINPPPASSTSGTQVYASDLRLIGNRVIAAYNVPGNTQRGWIDLIDVTTLAVPILVDSKYFADTDINSIAMHSSGKFSLVGAKEGIGTVVRTGTFGLTGLSVSATETYISSYAGTGVTYDTSGTKLIVTSGSNGGVDVFNASTMANLSSQSLADARGITYHAATNKYYAVKGQTGAVQAYDTNGAATGSALALGGATIAESKSTIVAGSTFLLATTGDGGFNVICAADMKVAATQAQFIFPNYQTANLPGPTLTVTNGAAFGPGMIFTAAGEAGIRVYNFVKKSGVSPTACANVDVSYMGYFDFSQKLSANNLVYVNVLTTLFTYSGVLYVADGGGGFKAVTVTATRSTLNDILD